MIRIMIKLVFLSFAIISVSCADEKKEQEKSIAQEKVNENIPKETEKSDDLNISILMDLSDRISPEKYPNPTMEYYERDVAYINSIAEAFLFKIGNKRINQIDDQIQVFFEPEPQNREINKISNRLKFSFDKTNVSKEALDGLHNTYQTAPEEIYKLAIEDDNYIGSDTWSFFKNKVHDYTIEEGKRNILIILTDGYLFHINNKRKEQNRTTYLTPEYVKTIGLNTQNWEDKVQSEDFGFIPATENLENLEVLILGINPNEGNQYAEDVIFYYWSEWLEKMGVKHYDIKKADLPANLDEVIERFILAA
ncbi:hypothetical protein [uncultured Salegentibacter sp.]|uniref:hypothetical protein n=1 Tax=uncultured Salegentibacter sp. TaxID=259320 RepID=UPI002591A8F2|nr:hypothetical protein [uncultured Salegentibacter sp.]